MLPLFLKLSPTEEDLYKSLIKNHVLQPLVNELTNLVEPFKNNDQYMKTVESVIESYVKNWIVVNTNYPKLLVELLKKPQFESLNHTNNLDQFMQQYMELDPNVSPDHYNNLTDLSIPVSQRYFNLLVILTADYLGNLFIDNKSSIIKNISKELYDKMNMNMNMNINPNIKTQKKYNTNNKKKNNMMKLKWTK
jgi:hypothetical protein